MQHTRTAKPVLRHTFYVRKTGKTYNYQATRLCDMKVVFVKSYRLQYISWEEYNTMLFVVRVERYPFLPSQKELPEYVLAEVRGLLPNVKRLPSHIGQLPYVEFFPRTFDELYAQKEALQTARLAIPRDYQTQTAYIEYLARIARGLDPASFVKEVLLRGRPIAITRNDYPARVSDDTIHKLLWWTDEVTDKTRLYLLANWMIENDIRLDDIVIVQNPFFRQSITQIPHWHIFQRIGQERTFDCFS